MMKMEWSAWEIHSSVLSETETKRHLNLPGVHVHCRLLIVFQPLIRGFSIEMEGFCVPTGQFDLMLLEFMIKTYQHKKYLSTSTLQQVSEMEGRVGKGPNIQV